MKWSFFWGVLGTLLLLTTTISFDWHRVQRKLGDHLVSLSTAPLLFLFAIVAEPQQVVWSIICGVLLLITASGVSAINTVPGRTTEKTIAWLALVSYVLFALTDIETYVGTLPHRHRKNKYLKLVSSCLSLVQFATIIHHASGVQAIAVAAASAALQLLSNYLATRPWFSQKARVVISVAKAAANGWIWGLPLDDVTLFLNLMLNAYDTCLNALFEFL